MICPKLELLEGPMAVDTLSGLCTGLLVGQLSADEAVSVEVGRERARVKLRAAAVTLQVGTLEAGHCGIAFWTSCCNLEVEGGVVEECACLVCGAAGTETGFSIAVAG